MDIRRTDLTDRAQACCVPAASGGLVVHFQDTPAPQPASLRSRQMGTAYMPGTGKGSRTAVRALIEVGLARELTQNAPEWQVRNTARGGLSGGRWTKPDIVVATVNAYLSRPIPELNLYGFELKTQAGFELSSSIRPQLKPVFCTLPTLSCHTPRTKNGYFVWLRYALTRKSSESALIRLDDDKAIRSEIVLGASPSSASPKCRPLH